MLTQKFCDGLGAFLTGIPGQEPGDGAAGGWMKGSFWGEFFYEIDFDVFVGISARVSPDAAPSTPADLIEQTGLFPKFPGVEEDFKLLGFDSSPETQKDSHAV